MTISQPKFIQKVSVLLQPIKKKMVDVTLCLASVQLLSKWSFYLFFWVVTKRNKMEEIPY